MEELIGKKVALQEKNNSLQGKKERNFMSASLQAVLEEHKFARILSGDS